MLLPTYHYHAFPISHETGVRLCRAVHLCQHKSKVLYQKYSSIPTASAAEESAGGWMVHESPCGTSSGNGAARFYLSISQYSLHADVEHH